MDSQGGSFRGFSTDWLVGIPHSNKRGPICYPGAYSSFSTVWFAFSHPSPTSMPRKEMLCRGVLTVTFPLCQSCVARIAPSLNQAVIGHPRDAVGLSIWLDPCGSARFRFVLCFSRWAQGNQAVLCRSSLPPLVVWDTPHFVSRNESIGNVGVLWAGMSITRWEEDQIGTSEKCRGWVEKSGSGGKC